MKNIQYLDTLKQAFSITWKNKFLWFFGFLVLLGSIGTNLNVNDNDVAEQGQKIQFIIAFIQNNPGLSAILGLVMVMVLVGLFLLRILAATGIIKAVNDINLYRQLSVVAILKESRVYLVRLLLLELLIGTVLVIVAIVLAIPVLYLFAIKATLLASLAMAVAIVIILSLVFLAYFLAKYAGFYIILSNTKLRMSLELAYAIFVKNIKESLVMSLTILTASIVLLVAVLLLCLLLVVVFGPLGLIAYLIFAKTGVMAVLIIGILAYMAILGTVFSWYMSFLYASWLLFFQNIALEKQDKKKILEKVEVEGKIPSPEVV